MIVPPRGFGYLRDPKSDLDHPFSAVRPAEVARVSDSLRMVDIAEPARDQDQSSSCVAFASNGGIEVRRELDGLPKIRLSELCLYWGARGLGGYGGEDGGSHIRDAMKYAHRVGVCSASAWPFDLDRINDRPDEAAEVAAREVAGGTYERIDGDGPERIERVLDALQAECPVVFGTDVTTQFMMHRGDGVIPAPVAGDVIQGSHALVALGFDRWGARVRVKNSWGRGSSWGDDGWCWLAAEWFGTYRTRDVWTLRTARKATP